MPANPTWVEDVEPLLRGSCFHCHGASPVHQDAARWDFYDRSDPKLAAVGDFSGYLINGRDAAHFVAIRAFVDPRLDEGRRMPPPPAQRLDGWQLAVLDAWQAAGFPRGTRHVNQRPSIRWAGRPAFQVHDGDGEQVLGKLHCAGGEQLLPRSGRFQLRADLGPPCSAKLYDGQDLVEAALP